MTPATFVFPSPPELPRWVWIVVVALVALAVGLLFDEVAGLIIALLGGSAGAARKAGRASDRLDDELADAYRPNIPTGPDTTIEQIEDEVHDATNDSVDHSAPVGPGGTDTIADDVEWADDAR